MTLTSESGQRGDVLLRRGSAAYSGARLLLVALVLVVVALGGCSSGGGREPGEFRVGIEGSPASLDPRYATDAHGVRIIPLIFNGLLQHTSDGSVALDLAQRWQQPEPLVHRLTLRRGVKFHDGTTLDSSDVAATYRYIMNRENGSPHAGSLEALEAIETPDEYTVVFRLSKPYVSFPFQLTLGILPQELASEPKLGDRLIGTGPFRLARYLPDEEVRLTVFPEHFGGESALRTITFRIVRSATTRMLEIKSGGLDLLQNAVPPYSVKFLEREAGLKVIRASGSSYQYLGFNLKDPITSDVRVRRAVSHAVNREPLINYVMQGQARRASGVFTPEHWAYAAGAPLFDFDLEEAMRLLDEAGYPDPDGDGPGVRFTLSYKTSTDKTANESARVIADQLAKVGIGVEVMSFEWGTFFSDVKKGDFQLMSLRWVGLSDPDIFHYIYHSSSMPPGGANRGRYESAQVDGWIDASRMEPEVEKRAALYRKIQERVSEDCVYASLWWPDNVVVLREGFEGFVPLPGGQYTSLAKVRPIGDMSEKSMTDKSMTDKNSTNRSAQ
jgi:peptide/nickel transport system substrate-binding protein